jgi:hypothetical protein
MLPYSIAFGTSFTIITIMLLRISHEERLPIVHVIFRLRILLLRLFLSGGRVGGRRGSGKGGQGLQSIWEDEEVGYVYHICLVF